jgi:hypothetical protein
MNFKSLIIVGLGVATLGLSLPAHADDAIVVTNNQDAFISGSGNTTIQTNHTSVSNHERGSHNRSNSSTGTIVKNTQTADVAGDDNLTIQDNNTNVKNDRDSSRKRHYHY